MDRSRRAGKKTSREITLFPSNIQGGPIRNAVTGTPTGYAVGSSDERRFWKVVKKDVERWGQDENGEPVQRTSGYDSAFFYFESPEQYERLYDIVLPEEAKSSWQRRNWSSSE